MEQFSGEWAVEFWGTFECSNEVAGLGAVHQYDGFVVFLTSPCFRPFSISYNERPHMVQHITLGPGATRVLAGGRGGSVCCP